jgi:rRNA processing protein Krr1/Pno1
MRKKILEKIQPTTTATIFSGDENAVERLEEKIARLEAGQGRMKSANAAIRKNAKAGESAQIAALIKLGFNNEQAVELLKPDCFGGVNLIISIVNGNKIVACPMILIKSDFHL